MHTYPMLQRVSELYGGTKLGNVLLLACQHLLEPQQRMFEQLLKLGLKPQNCVIVGKNYSTNSEVLKKLRELGCVVAPFSDQFEADRQFDVWFQEKLTAFVRSEISSRPMNEYGKVLILDDGGFMHLIVDELCHNVDNVVGVEQTSSGHHRISSGGVRFPFISVARSHHKLFYESPYIAMNGKARVLKHLKRSGVENPRMLFLGLGPIGRLMAGQLLIAEKHEGCAFDPKLDEMRFGRRNDTAPSGVFDLFKPSHILKQEELGERMKEFDVIIGSTGTSALVDADIEKLHPNVTLISMSSSDREFPAVPFRHKGGLVHENYMLEGRTLVNAGFPITFDGLAHAMPPSQIELTMSLLMIRLLDQVTGGLHQLAHVVGQIKNMWQPYVGVEEWYKKLNRQD